MFCQCKLCAVVCVCVVLHLSFDVEIPHGI